jgi:nucleoside-diphosphate-sugar epimerase
MSHRVVITGISGYIGLHCAAEALRSGYRVRGSVRNASKEQGVRDTLAASVDTANLEFVTPFCSTSVRSLTRPSNEPRDHQKHISRGPRMITIAQKPTRQRSLAS